MVSILKQNQRIKLYFRAIKLNFFLLVNQICVLYYFLKTGYEYIFNV